MKLGIGSGERLKETDPQLCRERVQDEQWRGYIGDTRTGQAAYHNSGTAGSGQRVTPWHSR